jgi:hypothetical protein
MLHLYVVVVSISVMTAKNSFTAAAKRLDSVNPVSYHPRKFREMLTRCFRNTEHDTGCDIHRVHLIMRKANQHVGFGASYAL